MSLKTLKLICVPQDIVAILTDNSLQNYFYHLYVNRRLFHVYKLPKAIKNSCNFSYRVVRLRRREEKPIYIRQRC